MTKFKDTYEYMFLDDEGEGGTGDDRRVACPLSVKSES